MNRVHPAAWIGLVINLAATLYFITQVVDTYYMDTVDTVFLVLFLGGGLLSLAGVLMLASGSSAGGIVGLIGSIVFVPAGMVCAIGCMISRNRIKLGHLEQTDLQRAQEIVNRMQTQSATKDMGGESVQAVAPNFLTPPSQPPYGAQTGDNAAAAPSSAGYGQSLDASAGTSYSGPADSSGFSGKSSFSSITSALPPAPKVSFPFYDQRPLFGALLVVCVIAFFILASSYRGVPGSLVLPAAMSVFFIILNGRALKWGVFSFYDDYLECVPTLYSSPLTVQFTAIARADVNNRRAKLHVRRPDGGEDTITVPFGFVKGSLREEARTVFRQKMRDLGVLYE